MTDPHEILGLPRDADEAEARRRYLELVREFPPDRAPERFAEVRAAYDRVRDPVRRLEAQIFDVGQGESLDAIAADLRARLRDHVRRLPVDALLALAGTS
ncbi:MAG: J domain-containing protein [Planctomycetia bacterium]|nr:J domain-containing protein [Planctomycetia bacterium]